MIASAVPAWSPSRGKLTKDNPLTLIKPFRALRPAPERAADVLAPPYDVLSSVEARDRAEGKPWSFLHVSRAEIDLDPAIDPYDRAVYVKAAENFQRMIAAGVLVRDSRLVLERVGVNWTRAGFLRILERMGAIVLADVEPAGTFQPEEPIADIDVRNAPIEATTVEPDEVPLAIDELPLVALLGCFADGDTVVRGAGELRVKESDRIATVVEGLRGLGAVIEALPDGFVVTGTGALRGGRLDAHGDHRLALLGAVAGLASEEGVEVIGMEAAEVSYPGFADDVAGLIA